MFNGTLESSMFDFFDLILQIFNDFYTPISCSPYCEIFTSTIFQHNLCKFPKPIKKIFGTKEELHMEFNWNGSGKTSINFENKKKVNPSFYCL